MKLAICIVSPAGFVHSEAFREVAETLQAAAAALGHDCVLTSRSDLPGRKTIVLGPNLLARNPQPVTPGAILYNLEQAEPSVWFEPRVLDLFRAHPLWDYSERNADNLAAMGVPRPRVVPIGWDSCLERIWPEPEDIDVLFYGSLNPRRMKVIEAIRREGARVETVFGVFGRKRDALIARSRVVLNMHFFESKVFEIVRVSYLLANGRAVVSERGAAPEEEAPYEKGVRFAAYEEIPRACVELLQNPVERAKLGAAGRKILRARPAKEILQHALAAEMEAARV
jgi:hypothetical protein